MSSLLTNMSAMSALQNLSMTQKSLAAVQSQVSSGLAVANASDNASYWSISTSMKSDTSALSAVTNALNLGASVISTATSAISSVNSILKAMKADLITAQTTGTTLSQVQTGINAQQSSLKNIIASASFNQVNLLDGSTASTQIVSSFARTTLGNDLGTISVDTAAVALAGGAAAGGLLGGSLNLTSVGGTAGNTTSYTTDTNGSATASAGYYASDSILAFTVAGATPPTTQELAQLSSAIDKAITSVTAAAAQLGTYTSTINNQLTFVSALSDAITSGVGSLVDADMNAASTRLNALQTQQQLGVQSLSIANQNSQLILKLFQ